MLDYQDIIKALKSLADPKRSAVFEAVFKAGEIKVSALTREFDVSQPAISQHLKHLRDAGLVVERRNGREAFYRVTPDGLTALRTWLDRFEPVAKRNNARAQVKTKRLK